MQKYFVTGGAGFIGSHLVGRLLQGGNKVTVYDNLSLSTGENIKKYQDNPDFNFIKADLLDFETLKKSIEGYDVIWHLGANTNIPLGNQETDRDLQNCTVATRNILEAMKQTGLKKVLFTSSATVYGDVPSISLSETYGPLLPISLYGAGKLAGEGLMSAYSHLFGIQAFIFRFANVVGGGMNHGVIFDFIQKLKKDPKDLEILGDGKQEKPFFLVEDCIEGMLCALNNQKEQYNIHNLGCDTFTPVTRVAEIVMEEMGLKDVKVHCKGGQRGWPGDVPVTRFNIDKIKKLGWQPRYDSDGAVRVAAQRILKNEF